MKWLAALALLACWPASAQMWPSPGPGHAKYTEQAPGGGTDYSLALDGNENGAMTTAATLGIGAAWSVSVWVRPTNLASAMYALNLQGATTASRIQISVIGTSAFAPLRVYVQDTGATLKKDYRYSDTAASWFTLDTWTHLVVTFDGSTLITYFNGTAHASNDKQGDDTIATSTETRKIFIGSDANPANRWIGNIGPIAIWSTVLGTDEVAVLYNAGKFGFNVASNSGSYTSSSTAVHWFNLCNVRTTITTALQDSIGSLDPAGAQTGLVVGENCVEVAP